MHARLGYVYQRVQAGSLGWLVLVAAAVLPTILYWFAGYSGDDFAFHTTSWIELHQAWQAHAWELGWAAGAHFGLGSPRFCFYPPFNEIVSTALSFVLPFRLVPGVLIWLILTAAGLSMYVAATRLIGKRHRVTAALFFMLSGYMLLATIRRYDVAESWVDATLPLTFLFYLRVVHRQTRQRSQFVGLALMLAFGWLTNIPAAIITAYAFGACSLLISLWHRRFKPLVLFAGAECTAVALTAFRLVPALVEKKWVHAEALFSLNLAGNMLLHSLPRHDLILFFLDATLIAAVLLSVLAARSLREACGGGSSDLCAALLMLAGIAVFCEVPLSLPLWRFAPELSYAAFPWRFQAFLMLGPPLLLFAAGIPTRLRLLATLLWIPFAVFPFISTFHEITERRFPDFAVAAQDFEHRYRGVPEYLPATAPLDPHDVYSLTDLPLALAGRVDGCSAKIQQTSANRQLIAIGSPSACRLVVGTFCYPFWHASLSGQRSIPVRCTSDGLIALDVPGGKPEVRLSFEPRTRARAFSTACSVLVLLLLLISMRASARWPQRL